MKPGTILLRGALVMLLVIGGWYSAGLLLPQRSGSPQLVGPGARSLPEFSFTDLEGETRHSSEWRGQPLVVNFWATWCPPCRKEMPLFVEMQEKYRARGIQFVGIAIDDPAMVRDFRDVYGINFPLMIGGSEAVKLANTLGNRFDSLPFTAIFDREGVTKYVQAGEVTRDSLEQYLLPLL